MSWADPATPAQLAELRRLAEPLGEDVPARLLATEAAQRIDELRRASVPCREAMLSVNGRPRPVETVDSAFL